MNDASVSLPLLEGLYSRPGVCQSVVKDALGLYQAGRRIGRWSSTQWRRRRSRRRRRRGARTTVVEEEEELDQEESIRMGGNRYKRRKVIDVKPSTRAVTRSLVASPSKSVGPKSVTPLSEASVGAPWEHWIFRSLRSSSLSVRQVACRILLQGTGSRKRELRDALLSLVEFHVLSSPITPGGGGGDYSIQLMGLLTHLLVEDTSDLQEFCAGGGLRWVASSILKLVAGLFPLMESNPDADTFCQTNRLGDQSSTTLLTIQTRLILFVDLCHRLVLFASVPSSKDVTSSPKTSAKEGAATADSMETSRTTAHTQPHREETVDVSSKRRLRSSSVSSSKSTANKEHDEEKQRRKEASLKRLATLRRVHHLLWTSTIPATFVLKEGTSPLSPLACLLYAYEVLRDSHPLPAKMRGMETSMSMLARLVDPTASVVLSTSSSSSRHNKDDKRKSRSERRRRHERRKQRARNNERNSSRSSSDNNNNESTTSAAAAMARAVSAAMDALEHAGDGEVEVEDVIMEDIDEAEHEEEEGDNDGEEEDDDGDHEEADDEATEEQEEDDDEEFLGDDGVEGDEDDEEVETEAEAEDEEEDEHDIVIPDDDVARFEERLLDLTNGRHGSQETVTEPMDTVETPGASLGASTTGKDRKRTYICTSMQVLAAQHPHVHHLHATVPIRNQSLKRAKSADTNSTYVVPPLLSQSAEQRLLKSVCDVVKPPRKPLNLKIYMKRAPTQEEFFRGSLSRNPIPLSSLKHLAGSSHGTGTSGSQGNEPTVRDLRQHIADDLQMSDSAELLELLVANKILDSNLKLRVVQQVLWKNHLMENSSTSLASTLLSTQSGHSVFSAGPGISMVFSSGSNVDESSGRRRNINADTPVSALPPMVVTYRLAGVDGEATEDQVDEGSLADPEAPSPSETAEAHEQKMEKEYGITRLITEGRGIFVLLRSIESHISDRVRRIRRDDVVLRKAQATRSGRNPSRVKFMSSAPCTGLNLLQHCSKLACNRKILLEARAPTVLLRLLLDVLNALDESAVLGNNARDGVSDRDAPVISNPTAKVLQELIELLASDISAEASKARKSSSSAFLAATNEGQDEFDSDAEQDASTLPVLLSSLRTTFLIPPLRKVIAKLLPFLTYGQLVLSRELAMNINKFVHVDELGDCESADKTTSQSFVLMDTFVQTAISLPRNEVCNSLRMELIRCGFVERLVVFILRDIPTQPPPWSPALWSKQRSQENSPLTNKSKRTLLEQSWRAYFLRDGLRTAFRMLTGFCTGHAPIQSLVGSLGVASDDESESTLLRYCHWIESTSDNTSSNIQMNGMGILAETLLDELKEDDEAVAEKVGNLRKQTRQRKKELAEERRSKALVSLSSFGPLAGAATAEQDEELGNSVSSVGEGSPSSSGVVSSLLAPVLGFFRDQSSPSATSAVSGDNATASRSAVAGRPSPGDKGSKKSATKPTWLAEMEAMEDETGLTCAVCQEGRTLQPGELLGLYSYVKKVSIPYTRCGGPGQTDGTMLLISLPSSLPESLVGTHIDHEYFQPAKKAGVALRSSPHASSVAQSRRPNHFVTTVSAGNAIHCSCHARARSADRNHPKAPKSEWEGASLRNSRVSCNAILPLVSSRSSKVSLVAVEIALTDHQTVISNLLGARPKSMLWTVLQDIRLLLLRMAYGEALNADCGGGSLSSNVSLIFHQMFMADMFANDAEYDNPETARHARFLSGGFLAACEIMKAEDFNRSSSTAAVLLRNMADAAPMAGLCAILFNNEKDDDLTVPGKETRWALHKENFLCGLICYAGRRSALGVEDSGCITSRGATVTAPPSKRKPSSILGKRGRPEIEEFAAALRPMITLYAILDQLSAVFVLNANDESVEESASQIVKTIESCQRTSSIHELLQAADARLDQERIIEEFQRGKNIAG